jgi:predicted Zn-dependent protease
MTQRALALVALSCLAALGGCATNPVTGERELSFVSTGQEIAIGEQNYAPARQMQGGDYVLEPELTAYVSQVGQRLAAASGRSDLPYEFNILNNSVPNAWALPGGKIAINRGLLTELGSEAELAAVLGHEVVHAAARHGAQSMQRGMLMQAGLIAVQISQQDNEYGGYVVGGAQLAAQLLSQKYGRNAELQSDLYGMRYMKAAGYNPYAAVELQETFVRLSGDRQASWLEGLFASHPPSQARVERNRATAAELGADGEFGRERYQRAISTLIRNEPAYEAYDNGVKALAAGDTRAAGRYARTAIGLEPREAKFHGLLGDATLKGGDPGAAIRHYDAAIERNPGYFQPWLTRGLAKRELGQRSAAMADLERSVELLPTAPAYSAMGLMLLEQGRRDEAIPYLEAAAGSDSPAGREAAGALARVQPERFLETRIGTDANNYVAIQIINRGSVTMDDVTLDLVVLTADGSAIASRDSITLRDAIPAGQAQVVNTRLGPVADAADLRRVRVSVTGARAR